MSQHSTAAHATMSELEFLAAPCTRCKHLLESKDCWNQNRWKIVWPGLIWLIPTHLTTAKAESADSMGAALCVSNGPRYFHWMFVKYIDVTATVMRKELNLIQKWKHCKRESTKVNYDTISKCFENVPEEAGNWVPNLENARSNPPTPVKRLTTGALPSCKQQWIRSCHLRYRPRPGPLRMETWAGKRICQHSHSVASSNFGEVLQPTWKKNGEALQASNVTVSWKPLSAFRCQVGSTLEAMFLDLCLVHLGMPHLVRKVLACVLKWWLAVNFWICSWDSLPWSPSWMDPLLP